jgi:hypothetical protein
MRKVGSLVIIGINSSSPGAIAGALDAALLADQLEGALGVMNQENVLVLLGSGLADA